jgi:hypothetical protein
MNHERARRRIRTGDGHDHRCARAGEPFRWGLTVTEEQQQQLADLRADYAMLQIRMRTATNEERERLLFCWLLRLNRVDPIVYTEFELGRSR